MAREVVRVVYSRADLLRILHLTPRQLANWERAGLIVASPSYSFSDLLKIKKVRDLCAMRVRPAVIRAIARCHAEAGGGHGKPVARSGRFVHQQASRGLSSRRQAGGAHRRPVHVGFRAARKGRNQHTHFYSAPTLREDEPPTVCPWHRAGRGSGQADPGDRHIQKVLEFHPDHAAAHINLGTLYYNRQDFAVAEKHYRAASQADPRYALAYFDLGNVLDETGRVQEAHPDLQDGAPTRSHLCRCPLQLALAYEKISEPRKALRHWRAYIKLDTTGPWSVHARNQIQRILQADTLKLVQVAASSDRFLQTSSNS